jgi:hypothetical protein
VAHLEVARCGAATLLDTWAAGSGEQAAGTAAVEEAARGSEGKQLFHAAALQLWLLKCCQAVRV